MLTPEPSPFLKKIRHLTQALIISGMFNIGLLAVFSYWVLKERPPTPYFELKPANKNQQQLPLADHRSCGEAIAELSKLPFDQLLEKLTETKLIENGYTERDLALACLVNFHHFDLPRALSSSFQPQQRLLMWKNRHQAEPIPLSIYSGLTDGQFDSIIQLAKTEQWPLTSQGLFLLL